jgi:G protein-coupled receptor 107
VLITTAYGELELEEELAKTKKCALKSDMAVPLFTFDEIDTDTGIIERSFELDEILDSYDGGELIVFFANCEPSSAVDFDVTLSLYNQHDGRFNFLPAGEALLPLIYFVAFIIFAAMGAIWSGALLRAGPHAHKIHFLMLVLVVFKSLTLLSQAIMYHMISVHGHPEGWNIAYYFFTALRGVLFFLVVILIATGYSYMKPFLTEREKNIILLVIPLQVLSNLAIIVTDEMTPATVSWFAWTDIFHIVDVLCCCAVLFPIVWSIKHYKDAAEMDDGKSARVASKLGLFKQFYIMVVSYIYFTRIIVYLLEMTLPFQQLWMAAVAAEAAAVVFYVVAGLQFRPSPGGINPYFALEQEEIELSRDGGRPGGLMSKPMGGEAL